MGAGKIVSVVKGLMQIPSRKIQMISQSQSRTLTRFKLHLQSKRQERFWRESTCLDLKILGQKRKTGLSKGTNFVFRERNADRHSSNRPYCSCHGYKWSRILLSVYQDCVVVWRLTSSSHTKVCPPQSRYASIFLKIAIDMLKLYSDNFGPLRITKRIKLITQPPDMLPIPEALIAQDHRCAGCEAYLQQGNSRDFQARLLIHLCIIRRQSARFCTGAWLHTVLIFALVVWTYLIVFYMIMYQSVNNRLSVDYCPVSNTSLTLFGHFAKSAVCLQMCHYTGALYCQNCHSNCKAVLPANVLAQWNFEPQSVSNMAKEYLTAIHEQPVLRIFEAHAGNLSCHIHAIFNYPRSLISEQVSAQIFDEHKSMWRAKSLFPFERSLFPMWKLICNRRRQKLLPYMGIYSAGQK